MDKTDLDPMFVFVISALSSSTQTHTHTHLISSLQFGVKLTEDLLQLLTDHVGQHVQTAPGEEGEGGRGEKRERMNVTKRERKGGEANRQR